MFSGLLPRLVVVRSLLQRLVTMLLRDRLPARMLWPAMLSSTPLVWLTILPALLGVLQVRVATRVDVRTTPCSAALWRSTLTRWC